MATNKHDTRFCHTATQHDSDVDVDVDADADVEGVCESGCNSQMKFSRQQLRTRVTDKDSE